MWSNEDLYLDEIQALLDEQGDEPIISSEPNTLLDVIACNEPICPKKHWDYTELFTSNQRFNNKDELITYARRVGKIINSVLIICRMVKLVGNVKGKVWLGYERSGVHKNKKMGDVETVRRSGTKKCQCPFLLQGVEENDGRWIMYVLNGRHNHELGMYLEGHAFAGRLNNNEYEVASEMTKSHAKPKEILLQIKRNDDENKSTIKHIYNALQKMKMEDMDGRSVLQQFLHQIINHNYYEWHRRDPGTDILSDILFAHPASVDLLHAFPYVLIMDCTYKINRYKMPFLEVVGFTSTHRNFSIAFAFLSSEKIDNYLWAMERIRQLFEASKLPLAIVTDRDLALINAVEIVFPESTHLLCRRHIYKCIDDKCTKVTRNKGMTTAFLRAWIGVVEAKNDEEYYQQLYSLELDFHNYPSVLSYVQEVWLCPFKERIVSAWVNQIMHFGTHTTNRVESAHSRLKRFLGSSTGSFDTIWLKIHSLIELQMNEIKGTFETSLTKVPHHFTGILFRHLRGHVSHKALQLLLDEIGRQKEFGADTSTCGCYLRRTHGLPCAHELTAYVTAGLGINLSEIHPFWRQLDIEVHNDARGPDIEDPTAEFEHVVKDFVQDFYKKSLEEKKKLVNQLNEIRNPSITNLQEPPTRCTKGRPRNLSTRREPSMWEYTNKIFSNTSSPSGRFGSRGRKGSGLNARGRGRSSKSPSSVTSSQIGMPFVNDVDDFMIPFIRRWKNVIGDGNCGYRSVAEGLGMSEEDWPMIRRDLFLEIRSRRELYGSVFVVHSVDIMLQNVAHWQGECGISHWMTMPDMGHVIATRYHVALVMLSKRQSITFLPLINTVNHDPPNIVIAVAFIEVGSHFIMLNLTDNAPMPPLMPNWLRCHDITVDRWDLPFQPRIQEYLTLRPHVLGANPPTNLS